MLTQQLFAAVRRPDLFQGDTPPTEDELNGKCFTHGVDQGFHNYLIYSGLLNPYMDIKYYPQGEGPVNTLGAFYGSRVLLSHNLSTWKIIRGTKPDITIHNWNGDISPAVHQYDRFE